MHGKISPSQIVKLKKCHYHFVERQFTAVVKWVLTLISNRHGKLYHASSPSQDWSHSFDESAAANLSQNKSLLACMLNITTVFNCKDLSVFIEWGMFACHKNFELYPKVSRMLH